MPECIGFDPPVGDDNQPDKRGSWRWAQPDGHVTVRHKKLRSIRKLARLPPPAANGKK